MYKQCNLNITVDIYVRKYEEYINIIPYNWIESKKSQLQIRFQKRLLEIEA